MKRTFVRKFGHALLAVGLVLVLGQTGRAQGFYVHQGHYGHYGHYGAWGPPPRPYYPVVPAYPPVPYGMPAPVPVYPYGPAYPGAGYQTGAALTGVASVIGALRH